MTREDKIKREILNALGPERDSLQRRRVVLFGSRATHTASPRSDFDIGIDGERPLPRRDFFRLQDRLEAIPTLYRIDLVDLADVSPRFRHEALKNVEVLIGSQDTAR